MSGRRRSRRSRPIRRAPVAGLAGLAGTLGLLLFAPAAVLAAVAERPRVEVSIEPAEVTVGERATATVLLVLPGDGATEAPRFPAWGAAWGGAEVAEVGPVERLPAAAGAGRRFRQRLVLAAFRPGRLELPPKAVVVPGLGDERLATPADLALTVSSVLPAEGEGAREPAPPAPPRRLPAPAAFWWTLAAFGTAILAAVALLVARGRAEAAADAAAAPPAAPADELVAALAAVEREREPVRAHLLLSRALRRYLGRTFGFPAPQSSTPEVRRELAARRAPATAAARAGEILAACDRVKFAGETAPGSTVAARAAAAREIAAAVEAHFARPERATPGAPPAAGRAA